MLLPDQVVQLAGSMAMGFEASELFTCCVCRQDFATEPPASEAPDMRPVGLPCGHSICARCGIEVRRLRIPRPNKPASRAATSHTLLRPAVKDCA